MVKKICSLFFILFSFVMPLALHAARETVKTQSVVAAGISIKSRVGATNLYAQECHDQYFGCMNEFCLGAEDYEGACVCSDDYEKHNGEFEKITATLKQAENLETIEVEKIKLGANADIVMGDGTRQYDAKGNVIGVDKKTTSRRSTRDILAGLKTSYSASDDIGDKQGGELFIAADDLCLNKMDESCDGDMKILKQLYSTQIRNDCNGMAAYVAGKKTDAELALADANSAVRDARNERLKNDNALDRGQCMIAFKKCMKGGDVCGPDWDRCTGSIAEENMQNKKRTGSVASNKVKHTAIFNITDSVQEMLDSKRYICEGELNKCMAVRDLVYDDFLREVAPELKLAERNSESKRRMSCLTSISDCIHTACKDDIEGKGVETMDSCLSRPEMARSFCKYEVESCERMEKDIWGYVKDKLAAMRVDRCTEEVRECFTDDGRCGKDFGNCIGLDYDEMHKMCPLDKLIVCKQGRADFSMNDIDSLLMGFYLNVDNSALEKCQKVVDDKMVEICGSTTECNKFAADDNLGSNSVVYRKNGDKHVLSGMISYGMIKVGNGFGVVKDDDKKLAAGEIGVADYIREMKSRTARSSSTDLHAVQESIQSELNNVAGTINRTIELMSADPEVQFCISGRDMTHINGGGMTQGRFPHLMDQMKMVVAESALRQATNNYNKKFQEELAKATSESSIDLANAVCNRLPHSDTANTGINGIGGDTLVAPYSIILELGGVSDKAIAGEAGQHVKSEFQQSTREMWSNFDRATRTCHVCTSTTVCTEKKKNGLFGLFGSRTTECSEPTEKCEDLHM
ncbi:MAG: hypothetical protein LBO08_00540 [Rickettsiales bacterium]|jgi:hypothetical protein|nr:hypothetical protein [Rickettsiales bacterium]